MAEDTLLFAVYRGFVASQKISFDQNEIDNLLNEPPRRKRTGYHMMENMFIT